MQFIMVTGNMCVILLGKLILKVGKMRTNMPPKSCSNCMIQGEVWQVPPPSSLPRTHQSSSSLLYFLLLFFQPIFHLFQLEWLISLAWINSWSILLRRNIIKYHELEILSKKKKVCPLMYGCERIQRMEDITLLSRTWPCLWHLRHLWKPLL